MNTETTALVPLTIRAVASPNTRRTYSRGLRSFMDWSEGQLAFSRDVVLAYLDHLRHKGASAVTINQHLTAIKLLAREAEARGMSHAEAQSIISIPGIRQHGVRMGHWLSKEQAQRLLQAPDDAHPRGKRDRALLGLLLGCALRRAEAAAVTVEHIQVLDGRAVIHDLIGKGGRVRTVPMPAWCHERVLEWLECAGIAEGPVLRPVNKAGRSNGHGMTDSGIWRVVKGYAQELGFECAPHDLRRTFGKLGLKGGADIRQIQKTYGHSSQATTEKYLGDGLDLEHPACDYLGVEG